MAAKSVNFLMKTVTKPIIDEEVVQNFLYENYDYLKTKKGEGIRLLIQTAKLWLSEEIPEWMKQDMSFTLTSGEDSVTFKTNNNKNDRFKITWKRGTRDRIIEHVQKSATFRRQQIFWPALGYLLVAVAAAGVFCLAAAVTGPLAAYSLSALGVSWANLAGYIAGVVGTAGGVAAGILTHTYDSGNMINGRKTEKIEWPDRPDIN